MLRITDLMEESENFGEMKKIKLHEEYIYIYFSNAVLHMTVDLKKHTCKQISFGNKNLDIIDKNNF